MGFEATDLILHPEDAKKLKIHPLIHKFMGMEVWIDETISEGEAYLLDRSYIRIDE